jgi:hypothetical protein
VTQLTRQPSAIAAQQIDWINALDRYTDDIISTLPDRTDEEILELRTAARAGERTLWRLQAACDAEILDRVKLKGGRGQKDTEGVGVDATVRRIASEIGVTPRTIYQNAQIHKTFFDDSEPTAETPERALRTLGPVDHLEEKEFFKAALRSPDPHETLEYFARQKAADPNFSTGDAWRIVKGKTPPALDSELPAIATPEVMTIWRDWCQAGQDLGAAVPPAAEAIRYAIEEIKYIIETPAQTVQQRIIHLIQNQEINELDPIAHAMSENREVVRVWLNRMIEDGVLETRIQTIEERVPGARGPARTYYEIA